MRLPPRARSALAWSLWVATVAGSVIGLLSIIAWTRPLTLAVVLRGTADTIVLPVGFATIGLVLALRRPGNPIGWLFAASGLAWCLMACGTPWVLHLAGEHRPLPPAAQFMAVWAEVGWAPATALGVTLPALLLPDGRLRSPRWRVVVVATVTGALAIMVGGSLAPGQMGDPGSASLFGPAGSVGPAAGVVEGIGVGLHFACLIAAALSVVLRFPGSRGVERQQLRWATAGAAGAAVGLVLAVPGGRSDAVGRALIVFGYLGILCPPVAVAVAVLRYRLWDLDHLVSRTVTYALVTALLVLPYLLILPAAARLAAGSGNLAVAAATLVAAAAFAPVRRTVQDRVDRRFNRRRYDAARTVEAFAARLRHHVDLDTLSAELLAVVDHTMQPTKASLWLRPPAAPLDGERTGVRQQA
jgi:hypothetical protein